MLHDLCFGSFFIPNFEVNSIFLLIIHGTLRLGVTLLMALSTCFLSGRIGIMRNGKRTHKNLVGEIFHITARKFR